MLKYKIFTKVKFFLFCVFISILPAQRVYSGYQLQPISGADGVFETVDIDSTTVYRTIGNRFSYHSYMYFKCSEGIQHQIVYLEVIYKDIGYGIIGVEYNSTTDNYKIAATGYENFVLGTGRDRTAVFELTNADFRNAQNLESDLRLRSDGSFAMHIVSASIYLEPTPLFAQKNEDWISPYTGPGYIGDHLVDANSLAGKVICGYQGWFRAGGDPSGQGWGHYVHGDFSDLTVEMWPDMSEYSDAEKYPVPGWTHTNGDPAYLFSSANKKTVIRHFQWMESYGIDGVAVQRFVSGLNLSHPIESFRIAGYAREAANRTGRTYFIMYDMSGNENVEKISDDWRYLVDVMKITEDDRYLHHNGKPVVGVFGFFADRFDAALGNRILDIFQNGGQYQAFVVGSGQWWWRSEYATGWSEVFRRMDAWIPWNVGNYSGDYATTHYWQGDKNELWSSGVLYMPLVFPGSAWDNLMNKPPGTTNMPRLRGDFLWQQFRAARNINATAVYVAMFDEIDEATAIFKVTNDIPINHYFLTLEGLPSDFYLLLTGFGTKIINGQVTAPYYMPDFAAQSQPPIPDILSPVHGDTVDNPVSISWTAVQHSSGIDGYELVIDNQVMSETTTEKVVDLEEGLHTLRVRAINGLNVKGGFSEAVVFTVIEDYLIKSPYLQNPEKAIDYVDSCAKFWLNTYDDTQDGFFTYIDKYGNETAANKNTLTQTRNAYGFVRAYMLTGDITYLSMARKGLDFMYQHAWDSAYGGWYRALDINGNPTDRYADKITFDQLYALLGISAYYEATADTGDFQWLMDGYDYNENFYWDNRPSYLGYYDTANFNGSNGRNKSFNATVDAITTHMLYLYLLTEDQAYKIRLEELADQIIKHLVASMDFQAIGFVEKYDSDWNWNDNEPMTIMGHVLKAAWCLARIYHIDPNNAYISAAEKLVSEVLQKGYDHELGGPYKDYNRITGEMLMWGNPDIIKTGWAMEQALTSGLQLYGITGDTQYLQMADESLDFFMTYFIDHEYGEVYMDRTRTGGFAWNEDKGNEWKAAYHSIEMGYYVYLYGNLFVKHEPVTLHYHFVESSENRSILMTPLAIADSNLRIKQVLWEGQSYTNYDPENRILELPAEVNGHFEVTYQTVATPDVPDGTTFNVTVPSSTPDPDIVYIAGTLNYWDPGPAQLGTDGLDHDLPLTAMDDNHWQITLSSLAGDTIEYKYTRGSWETVEKGTEGEEISNRLLNVPGGNHIQNDTVANWADIPASVSNP